MIERKHAQGKRADLNDTYFRSSWEANYARILNFQGKRWEYEPKTFYFEAIKRGTRHYTPDFYLPDEDRYIEVKGYNDAKSKTRAKRMAKYYPEVKIELVDAKRYKELQSYAPLIPTWESKAKTVKPIEVAPLPAVTKAPKRGVAMINGREVSYGEALRAAGLTADFTDKRRRA